MCCRDYHENIGRHQDECWRQGGESYSALKSYNAVGSCICPISTKTSLSSDVNNSCLESASSDFTSAPLSESHCDQSLLNQQRVEVSSLHPQPLDTELTFLFPRIVWVLARRSLGTSSSLPCAYGSNTVAGEVKHNSEVIS